MSKPDYVIVGAGLTGSVLARELTDSGKKVRVIEKSNYTGGLTHCKNVNGITVHEFGAHIFRTDYDDVWNYVNRFATFNRFTNSPIAYSEGRVYNLPFNMNTFNQVFGVITPRNAERLIKTQTGRYGEPKNLEEHAINLIGETLYKKFIKGYTEKQWGKDCKELPTSIIKRIPVRLTYDNDYFGAKYQGIPVEGYNSLIARLLDGSEVITGVDYMDYVKEHNDDSKVIYTGAVDSLFGYCFGGA